MTDTNLLAYLEAYITPRRKSLFDKVLQERTRHFTVAVEDVYQLHNTSAVLRSCDVFGIQETHVIEERNIKRLDREIAMGAQKWVDVHRYSNVKDCIAALKAQGYRIVATSPHDNSQFLSDFDITQKAAFFFGTETDGLSDAVLAMADESVKIPMYGFTESLNISVSAAILLQYVTDKLRKSDITWQFTPEEIFAKKLDWTQRSIKSIDAILRRYHEERQ